ncbi:MAG: GHKL domain-containing protein [Polyangiaceae bacterium]|nr:GHKL domain-containing protein [Polyangiaceae bacterium]
MSTTRKDLDLEPVSGPLTSPPLSTPTAPKTSRVTDLAGGRALPAAWLEELLTALVDAPAHDGLPACVQHVLAAVEPLLPGHELGVATFHDGERVTITPSAVQASVSAERLFPGRADEQILPASQGATLHLAADVIGEVELAFALRIADAVRGLFRAADTARRAASLDARLHALRAELGRAERLASVGRLAAQAAHELNSPLSAVVAYGGELGRRAAARGDAGEAALGGRIVEAAERSLLIARELVVFARPSRGREEGVSLVTVVERAITFSAHVLGGVEIERHFPPDLPTLRATSSELAQAIVNLLSNAAHALPKVGGKLSLSVEPRDADLALTVSDNGHGISALDLPRVFEPFFTTKPEGEGSGLGLPIVREIVEGHGGSVSVESDGATFTTFTLLFPLDARSPR